MTFIHILKKGILEKNKAGQKLYYFLCASRFQLVFLFFIIITTAMDCKASTYSTLKSRIGCGKNWVML